MHSPFMIYLFYSFKKSRAEISHCPETATKEWPFQVVQLPVYNENPEMVMRLIDSVCAMEYPHDRLYVQVLDDSDIIDISERLHDYVEKIGSEHPDLTITYLHRTHRTEFKAGNLKSGMEEAVAFLKGIGVEDSDCIFFSIFDADFLVPKNYLTDIVHRFNDPRIAAVQAIPIFENENQNMVTKAQAIFLTNLYRIDFGTRSKVDHLTVFLGSAGSWRLRAIQDAGGWQGDTQIEDVDLSFASQIRGWKIYYEDNLIVTSRLPGGLSAFKLQQRSWMKGIMEVMRKRLHPILSSRLFSLKKKLFAFDLFLLLPLQPLFIVLGHFSLIPAYYFLDRFHCASVVGRLSIGVFIVFCIVHIPFVSLPLFEKIRSSEIQVQEWKRFIITRMISFGLMTYMFVTFSYGIIEGLCGVKVNRDRTSNSEVSDLPTENKTRREQNRLLRRIQFAELLMSLYSVFLLVWAFQHGELAIFSVFCIITICYLTGTIVTFLDMFRKP